MPDRDNRQSCDGAASEQSGAGVGGEAAPGSVGGQAEADAERDAELAEAMREKDQFRALLQRTQADFVNYRKRIQAEQAEIGSAAKRALLVRLLGVMDSVEAALDHDSAAGIDEKYLEGVRAIERSFRAVLGGEGVERFESEGERFDPNLHEAVQRTPTSEYAADTVMSVMRTGYKFRNEVLRPALVEVASAPEEGEG